MPNYNPDTGIPYGVIACNSLPSWIWDEIDNMESPEEQEDFKDFILQVARECLTLEDFDNPDTTIEEAIAETDPDILQCLCADAGRDPAEEWEPDPWAYRRHGTIGGVRVSVAELGGALNLWVERSPFTGQYTPCSPCIPGAGDLDSPALNGTVCYDIPPKWREEAAKEKAEREAWRKASGLSQ